MKPLRPMLFAVVALLLASALSARAGDTDLLIGAGRLNLRHSPGIAYGSVEAAHLWGDSRYWGFWGAADLSDSADWVGGGLFATWPFAERWSLTISSGPGWYSEPNKLKLGSTLEFRSTAYLAYRWSRYGAGISVSHYSNAGTASYNPGTESVRLLFSIRLGKR